MLALLTDCAKMAPAFNCPMKARKKQLFLAALAACSFFFLQARPVQAFDFSLSWRTETNQWLKTLKKFYRSLIFKRLSWKRQNWEVSPPAIFLPKPTDSPTPTPIPTIPTDNPTTTPTPTSIPTPISTSTPTPKENNLGSWQIQSVSSMKETKDRICSQRSQDFIKKWVKKAKELGANFVALETPYDSPSCGSSVEYTFTWINTIREQGLGVWHRHMPLAFEGIYDAPKQKGNYFNLITDYIKNNAQMFKEGDIFTPIPEPQNGGIAGITYCAQEVCIFENKEEFNRWLREVIDITENAFSQIGLGGKIKIGYFGFDGFVAWGSNNPDWNGILEDETIKKMEVLAIDHYPELIGQTMEQGLSEVIARYPNVPIIISEWGSAGTSDPQIQVLNSMGAAKRPEVIGFNYWHLGIGGNEALINEDFSNRSQFDEVKNFFRATN